MDNTINSLVTKTVGVTDQQIKDFLASGPNDAQIAAAMQTYNVTPAQLSKIVGLPLEDVQARYKEAAPSVYTAENVNNLADQILSQGTTEKWTGGLPPETAARYMADELAKSGVTNISQVAKGDNGIINSMTGEKLISGYGERTGGNLWSGSYEGKGNTGFGVDFNDAGQPVFYTQGASSSTLGKDILKLAAVGGAIYGLGGFDSLIGAGATGGSTLGSLGVDYGLGAGASDVVGMGAGTGITGGYSGLGLNAGTAGLGAEGLGAGITAGSGLTGTGVLTGSALGTGLLGSSALNNLTGTGVLAGSGLGTSLLGTNTGTGLTGTGVLTGSGLGTTLLGTGAGSGVTGGVGGTGTLLGTGVGGSGTVLGGTGTGTVLGGTGTGTGIGTGTGTGLNDAMLYSSLASLLSGALGANAANSAADKQAAAAKYAADLQKGMFDTLSAQQAPYRAGGYNALNQIQGMLPSQYTKYDASGNPIGTATGSDYLTHQFNQSDFANNIDPGYAFRLQQGQMANQRLANKSGGLLGANAQQGMQDYTQGAASGEYQNAYTRYTGNQSNIYNRLASLAGIGQTGQTQTNTAAQAAATNMGNLAVGSAGAQAAGGIGAANAYGNALGSIGNNYMLAQLLGQKQSIG
jgi:hypothetical protein